MTELAVRRLGSGPAVVLVHGGIGPELSWERQEPLAERWMLVIPWRRGYGDSPPAERQDFEADAEDLGQLLEDPAHLVGFSYGGLSASIVAGRAPERVLSLTLIEPPFFALAADDPAVREMMSLSQRFFSADAAEDPEAHWAFLAQAGIERPRSPEEARKIEEWTQLARRVRPPFEAQPDLATVHKAPFPVLVVSGEHSPALDTVCDALAEETGAERLRLAGSRHAVQRADGFNDRLEAFLERAGAR